MRDFKDIQSIDFRAELAKVPSAVLKWPECQPRILVVTDGLSFETTNGFGLTQFISSLATGTIHGMTPQIKKASRGGALPGADIPNFKFDDPAQGLLKSRYDVVFILGINSEGGAPGVSGQLPQSEIDAVARFMQAGGGVFATGDHQSLGAAISRDLPRVRSMRFWKNAETPDVANEMRLSTNVSGPNEVEDFNDQSDRRPQSLYPNFRTQAGNGLGAIGKPALAHPLLQLPATATVPHPVIEVFPDHPHEGECHVPTNGATTFQLDSANVNEWPAATAGGALMPEVVAMTMSHGSGFPTGPTGAKTALLPRAFVSICAYDGQRANVGRVATDATWHHFVNINIDGTGESGAIGLRDAGTPPTDTADLTKIRQYYRNLATWLMPKNVRRCRLIPSIVDELRLYPLYEELVIPRPNPPDPGPFVDIGRQVVASMAQRSPAWEAESMLQDALAEAVGEVAAERLLASGWQVGRLGSRDLAYGALGAMTISALVTLSKAKDAKDIVAHKTFDTPAKKAAVEIVRELVAQQRTDLKQLDVLLEHIDNAKTM